MCSTMPVERQPGYFVSGATVSYFFFRSFFLFFAQTNASKSDYVQLAHLASKLVSQSVTWSLWVIHTYIYTYILCISYVSVCIYIYGLVVVLLGSAEASYGDG